MLEDEYGPRKSRRWVAIVLIVALALPVPALIFALYIN